MHALADWIAKLVLILYCIKIDIYIICSIVDQADCFSWWTFLYILVNLFVHSSEPFGGPFFVLERGGVFRIQKTLPGYGLVLYNILQPLSAHLEHLSKRRKRQVVQDILAVYTMTVLFFLQHYKDLFT